MRYRDGSVYDGQWFWGSMCGEGTMKFADGSSYEGEWLYDQF